MGRTLLGWLLLVTTFAAGTAKGGTLATAEVVLSDDCPICSAVNVGKKPIKEVTVEILDTGDGSVFASTTCSDLAPSRSCRPGVGCLGSRRVYCKITFTGSKSGIRAALSPDDEVHGPIVVLPAQ